LHVTQWSTIANARASRPLSLLAALNAGFVALNFAAASSPVGRRLLTAAVGGRAAGE
jgi:hypothetical protein